MSEKNIFRRIKYIDRLRGLAVLSMFVVHSAAAWLPSDLKQTNYYGALMQLSGMVAPVFVFLAGMSMALLASRVAGDAKKTRAVRLSLAVRGAKLVAIGYGLHVLFWVLGGCSSGWEKMLKVDILHCIGMSMIFGAWLAWPTSLGGAVRGAVAFVGLPILSLVNWHVGIEQWLPAGFGAYLTPKASLALFPFVPYGSWIFLGLFVGGIWAPRAMVGKDNRRFWGALMVAAMGMWGVGLVLEQAHVLWIEPSLGEPRIHKGLLHVFFFKGSMVLWGLGLLKSVESLLDRLLHFDIFALLGRHSLMAYCVHLILIYHVMGPRLWPGVTIGEHGFWTVVLSVTMVVLVATWSRKPWINGMERFRGWRGEKA